MLLTHALVLCMAIGRAEEPRSTVEGFVRDGNGNPIHGASVEVVSREMIGQTGEFRYLSLNQSEDGMYLMEYDSQTPVYTRAGFQAKTKTDKSGHYRISIPPLSDFRLSASCKTCGRIGGQGFVFDGNHWNDLVSLKVQPGEAIHRDLRLTDQNPPPAILRVPSTCVHPPTDQPLRPESLVHAVLDQGSRNELRRRSELIPLEAGIAVDVTRHATAGSNQSVIEVRLLSGEFARGICWVDTAALASRN